MKWISVKDRLPECRKPQDANTYLGYNVYEKKFYIVWYDGDWTIFAQFKDEIIDFEAEITHWMPLPEPPK